WGRLGKRHRSARTIWVNGLGDEGHFMGMFILLALSAFPVQTLDGHALDIDNWDERRGTVLLFMSSRCPVTAAMIPEINAIYERNRLAEVLFVGIVANDAENAEEIRSFCQAHGVRFPVYRDGQGALAAQLGATVTPEAFVFDAAA